MGERKTASLVYLPWERQRVSYGKEKEIQSAGGKIRGRRTASRRWALHRVLRSFFFFFFCLVGSRLGGMTERDGEKVFKCVFLCDINKLFFWHF